MKVPVSFLIAKRLCAVLPLFFLCAFFAFPVDAADLAINRVEAKKGETVTFTLSVEKAPNTVKAFILDIQYDFAVLSYRGVSPGALAESGYSLFRANNISPGVIRIGGVEPLSPGIQKDASGTLALLTFEVVDNRETDLRFLSLKDDMATWTTQAGYFFASIQDPPEAPEEDGAGQEMPSAEQAGTEYPAIAPDGSAGFAAGGYGSQNKTALPQEENVQSETTGTSFSEPETSPFGHNPISRSFSLPYGTHISGKGDAVAKETGPPDLQHQRAFAADAPGRSLSGSSSAKPLTQTLANRPSAGISRLLPRNEAETHVHINNSGQQAMLVLLAASLVIQTAMLVILILILIRLNAQAKAGQTMDTGAGVPAEGNACLRPGAAANQNIITLKKGV